MRRPLAKGGGTEAARSAQIQSAELDGHVVLTEEPAAKPGAAAQAPLRATAGRAVYEGAGEWLHLSLSPRVEDGRLCSLRRKRSTYRSNRAKRLRTET